MEKQTHVIKTMVVLADYYCTSNMSHQLIKATSLYDAHYKQKAKKGCKGESDERFQSKIKETVICVLIPCCSHMYNECRMIQESLTFLIHNIH